MIQDIIVYILIAAAVANIIYQIVKIRRGNAVNCSGCSECEMKSNIISKKL
jgi:hypothetical protein